MCFAASSISRDRVHRAHPARVELDASLVWIENLEDLVGVRLRVCVDFGRRERWTRRRPAGRVADHSGEVANQENDVVAEVLKLPHLVEQHRVPEVQIRRGGVETGFDDESIPASQSRRELLLEQDFLRSAP